jgi:hypothetical protein
MTSKATLNTFTFNNALSLGIFNDSDLGLKRKGKGTGRGRFKTFQFMTQLVTMQFRAIAIM